MSYQSTSAEAFASVQSSLPALQGIVFRFILRCGVSGATDEECQDALSMSGSTQRPRRGELEEKGLIFDTGTHRPSRSGRMMRVWRAVERG